MIKRRTRVALAAASATATAAVLRALATRLATSVRQRRMDNDTLLDPTMLPPRLRRPRR